MDPAHTVTEVGIDLRQNEGEELRVPHVALIITALETVQVLVEAHDTRILSLLVQLYSLKTTETSSVHSVRSCISTEDVTQSASETAGTVGLVGGSGTRYGALVNHNNSRIAF